MNTFVQEVDLMAQHQKRLRSNISLNKKVLFSSSLLVAFFKIITIIQILDQTKRHKRDFSGKNCKVCFHCFRCSYSTINCPHHCRGANIFAETEHLIYSLI